MPVGDFSSWSGLLERNPLVAFCMLCLVATGLAVRYAIKVQNARIDDNKASAEALVKATIAMEAVARSSEADRAIIAQVASTQREILGILSAPGRGRT